MKPAAPYRFGFRRFWKHYKTFRIELQRQRFRKCARLLRKARAWTLRFREAPDMLASEKAEVLFVECQHFKPETRDNGMGLCFRYVTEAYLDEVFSVQDFQRAIVSRPNG
jgi:predicted restriction endonuclease